MYSSAVEKLGKAAGKSAIVLAKTVHKAISIQPAVFTLSFSTHTFQTFPHKLIPTHFSKILSVISRLYTQSTGPTITTTFK
jgi:hypothetical protein